MTSYVTPKKNTAFILYTGLEDRANAGLFKASPTLAAGDFKVSIDGGTLNNVTDLPTVAPTGGRMVKITLTAAEMNGDNITVVASDAAGAEWYDLIINIQTTARQIDDLAFPTVSGRGLDVAATGEAGIDLTNKLDTAGILPTAAAGAENGLPILSAALTTSANVTELKGLTEPLDNLVLALGTGGLVEKLNSMLEAAGLAYRFTAEALAESPTEAGAGTGTYTDTIKDPSNNPLDGARVQLSTDAAGAHRVYEAFTNALGVFVMNPDPGTYYRWIDLAGYTDRLTQGAQVTVT